ncbi:hypothetical protein TNCV_1680321 [Trichonephila clavipes]|nr:hypothetical protein TNCV_1680321 [Trichonephila clavipes]
MHFMTYVFLTCISQGGQYDIASQVKDPKQVASKSFGSCSKLDCFFKDDVQSNVIRAEVMCISYLREYNVLLSGADYADTLYEKYFPSLILSSNTNVERLKHLLGLVN